MSIVEKTIKQLIRNRLHELVDMTLEINASSNSTATILVSPGSAHIAINSETDLMLASSLPPFIRHEHALENIEAMIGDVRVFREQAQ